MYKFSHSIILLFLFFVPSKSFGQNKAVVDPDIQIKEKLYKQYKKEVLSYDKNDFDALFFEYFTKQKDENLILTKEEFYSYTIKIAVYSEKLGLLYKDQKEISQRSKQDWFDKSYSDYLVSKKQ